MVLDGLVERFFEDLTGENGVQELRGFSAEQVLDFQDNAKGRRERFLISDFLNGWVDGMCLRFGSKLVYRSAIVRFFARGHVELPRDVGFVFHADRPKVRCDLNVDELRKIVLASNPLYRAVFLLKFQGGMGNEEVVFVNENYSEYIMQNLNCRVLRLDLTGRKRLKNRYPYYTFVGSDAIVAIKQYVQWAKRLTFKPLFLNEHGTPLTHEDIRRYFMRRCLSLGLIKDFSPECKDCGEGTKRLQKGKPKHTFYYCHKCGKYWTKEELGLTMNELCSIRYEKNSHEERDLFRTQCQFAGVDAPVPEFWMGHGEQVDPNDYNKFMNESGRAYVLSQYMKALPFLNIMSEEPRKVDRLTVLQELEGRDREIADLRDLVGRLDGRLEEMWKLVSKKE
jgi:hypothetical protein